MRKRTHFLIYQLLLMGVFLVFASSCKKDDNNNNKGFTDPRDGKVYKTVTIGTQVWMAENLAYAPSSGNYWAYDNDSNNVASYGYLYDWETALNVCPNGWHLPSDDEWTQLVDYLVEQGFPNNWDDSNGAGNALKSCRQVNSPQGGDCNTTGHPRWEEDNLSGYSHHGFDAFGFSGLPGAYRYPCGSFNHVGYCCYFWSSTELSTTSAWYQGLGFRAAGVYWSYNDKGYGFSVRCLRD